jgi:hypothetical protein
MTTPIDPKSFGLPPRTVLEQVEKGHIAIVVRRKSRIIMKDGQNILEKARTIRRQAGEVRVSLLTNAPVCSKTIGFLADNGIEVVQEK